MGTIVAGLFMSLDGVVDGSDGWQYQYFDGELVGDMNAGNDETGAIVVGRRTWEGYEELRAADPASPMIAFLDATPTWVVSSTLADVGRDTVTVVPADRDRIAAIARETDGTVLVLGSPQLVRWLIAEQLLDALSLYLMPTVIGSGARLFDDMPVKNTRLRLDRSTALGTGVLALRYSPITP